MILTDLPYEILAMILEKIDNKSYLAFILTSKNCAIDLEKRKSIFRDLIKNRIHTINLDVLDDLSISRSLKYFKFKNPKYDEGFLWDDFDIKSFVIYLPKGLWKLTWHFIFNLPCDGVCVVCLCDGNKVNHNQESAPTHLRCGWKFLPGASTVTLDVTKMTPQPGSWVAASKIIIPQDID